MKNVLMIVFLCFDFMMFAQEFEAAQELKMSVGQITYTNKLSIPNGVKGCVIGLNYSLAMLNSINESQTYFLIDLNTAGLNRNANVYGNKNQYVFFGGKVGVGKDWMFCNVSSCVNNKLFLGCFVGSEAEFVSCNQINENNGLIGAYGFGRWTTVADYTLRNQIKIEDVVIENKVSVPIFGLGYFPNAPYKSKNIASPVLYYLKPNDIICIGRLMQINYELRLGIPLGAIDLNLLYRYTYHSYTKGIEAQKYMLHQCGLSINF